jgi:hypothetical protein
MEPESLLPRSQQPSSIHVLSHVNPIHMPQSDFIIIHFNIIFSYTPTYLKRPLDFGIPNQNM